MHVQPLSPQWSMVDACTPLFGTGGEKKPTLCTLAFNKSIPHVAEQVKRFKKCNPAMVAFHFFRPPLLGIDAKLVTKSFACGARAARASKTCGESKLEMYRHLKQWKILARCFCFAHVSLTRGFAMKNEMPMTLLKMEINLCIMAPSSMEERPRPFVCISKIRNIHCHHTPGS